MNRYELERIAERSGSLGDIDDPFKKTAFWTTFSWNLARELEDEQADKLRRNDRFDIWED